MEPRLLEVTRSARYFQSGAEPASAGELWIVLHGYAQLAARFIRSFAPLEDGRTAVVAPEALSRFYLETGRDGRHSEAVGATWLTREHRDADLTDHLRYLDLLAARLHQHSAARVTLLGFSQGSVLAARWAARGTTHLHRLVLWGTPLPRDVPPGRLAASLEGRPLVLAAGGEDPFVPAGTLEADARKLTEAGAAVRLLRFPGGHAIPAGPLLDAAGRAGGA